MDGQIFRRSLKDILDIRLIEEGLDGLRWRDFGNGLFMTRLARRDKGELVLYRAVAGAAPGAFYKHEHIRGEFYLVLKGKIADETGEYEPGDMVYLDSGSVHTPRTIGETLVLVFWPEGVRILGDEKN